MRYPSPTPAIGPSPSPTADQTTEPRLQEQPQQQEQPRQQELPQQSEPSPAEPPPSEQTTANTPSDSFETARRPPPVSCRSAQQEKKTRTAVLYFVQVHDDGSISSQRVKRTIPVSDSPIQDTLETLLKGPTESELRGNLLSLIPSGTKLRGVSVRGSTATVDFRDAFGYNRYGKEGYMAQLRQIVYTLTEFQNVKDVQFFIEGKPRAFLTEGVPLDRAWTRTNF